MSTIWIELGIEPGSDEVAIRRAYARKLKVKQPEDDPAGFQQLREAYEQAMRMATRPKVAPAPARSNVEHAATQAAEPTPIVFDTETARMREELDEHARALAADLQSSDPSLWPRVGENQAHILTSPLLDDLTLRASIEGWMAHQIASHVPRSDTLVEPAAQFFGWDGSGFRQTSPAVAAVLRRRTELALIEMFRDPEYEGHRGWRALTQHDLPRWRHHVDAMRPDTRTWVAVLLKKMSTTHPGLRTEMNPEAVAWWQRRLSPSRWQAIGRRAPITLLLSSLATLAALVMLRQLTPSIWLGLSIMLAIATASVQVLIVRPRLASWMHRHRRAADNRWWIATLPLLVIGGGLPFVPSALLALVLIASVALSWQDAWLSAFPPQSGQRQPTWKIGLGIFWLAAMGAAILTSIGVPRSYHWLAISVPFAMIWFRGIGSLTIRLSRLAPSLRRLGVLASLVTLTITNVFAIADHGTELHFVSTLLAGPTLLLAILGLRFEPADWRQRLVIPYDRRHDHNKFERMLNFGTGHVDKSERRHIPFVDVQIDHPDRIILGNVIVHAGRQKSSCRRSHPSMKRPIRRLSMTSKTLPHQAVCTQPRWIPSRSMIIPQSSS